MLREIGERAKKAARKLNSLGSEEKNRGLRAAAKALLDGEAGILAANQDDVIFAAENGMSQGLIDRPGIKSGQNSGHGRGAFADRGFRGSGGRGDFHEAPSKRPFNRSEESSLSVVGIIYEARQT